MIYDINGDSISNVYDKDGEQLEQAYDISGNELLPTEPISFVVMSYNVQWFTGINSDETMQETIFDTYAPDVIGFQEFQNHSMHTLKQ